MYREDHQHCRSSRQLPAQTDFEITLGSEPSRMNEPVAAVVIPVQAVWYPRPAEPGERCGRGHQLCCQPIFSPCSEGVVRAWRPRLVAATSTHRQPCECRNPVHAGQVACRYSWMTPPRRSCRRRVRRNPVGEFFLEVAVLRVGVALPQVVDQLHQGPEYFLVQAGGRRAGSLVRPGDR